MNLDVATILGWIGMMLLLAAYAGRHGMGPRTYALLNLVGASLVGVVCFAEQAWPAFALEIAWAGIAIRDMLRPKTADRVGAASPSLE